MAEDKMLQDILEVVTFIKDNSVTKEEFNQLDQRVTRMETLMVTKDYLDEKLADLQGDLTILMRKEDTKLKTLVDILVEKQLINSDDKKRILTMEPFPEYMI